MNTLYLNLYEAAASVFRSQGWLFNRSSIVLQCISISSPTCSSPRLQTTLCHGRVLQKHRQQRFVCLLCFAASCTCCITLMLLRWLVVSVHQEMALMSWGLLNNADFYFCYVIKRLVMLRTKMQQLNPGAPELDCSLLLNPSPATCTLLHFLGELCHGVITGSVYTR